MSTESSTHTPRTPHTPQSSSRQSGGSRPSGTGGTGPASSGRLTHSVCAFWLGRKCYALDTGLVSEVVNIETVTPMPLAPPAIAGLFNLRGTPVAVVDLGTILDVHEGVASKSAEVRTALVLRTKGGILSAVLIDRMELVIPAGVGQFTPREGEGEQAMVQGFLEIDVRGGLVLTVLDANELLQRLERLKYR